MPMVSCAPEKAPSYLSPLFSTPTKSSLCSVTEVPLAGFGQPHQHCGATKAGVGPATAKASPNPTEMLALPMGRDPWIWT